MGQDDHFEAGSISRGGSLNGGYTAMICRGTIDPQIKLVADMKSRMAGRKRA